MPSGEAAALAWLFSAHHLNEAQRAEAARRIREGERPEPSRAQWAQAQHALGAALPDSANPPLTRRALAALVVANVLLTPLLGYALWFGLHHHRPLASAQAFRVTLPVTVALAGAWGAVVLGRMF